MHVYISVSVCFFFYSSKIKLIDYLFKLRRLRLSLNSFFTYTGWLLLCLCFLLIDLRCNICVLLVFILLNLDHVKYFHKWIFISGFKRVVLLVCRDLFLMLPIPDRSVFSKSVELSEIAVAISAYLTEEPVIFDVLSLLSLCLNTLPRFPDKLKHDKEYKELDEDDSEHVYHVLRLNHCWSNCRHQQLEEKDGAECADY